MFYYQPASWKHCSRTLHRIPLDNPERHARRCFQGKIRGGYPDAEGSQKGLIFIKALFFVAKSGKRRRQKITAGGETNFSKWKLCVGMVCRKLWIFFVGKVGLKCSKTRE
jgi:hypothetical protein